VERKEQMALGEALDEIVRIAQSLKQGQTSEFENQRFDMNEQVELHIEHNAHGESELEFEIKFRQGTTTAGGDQMSRTSQA
jgi:hypothetical protein